MKKVISKIIFRFSRVFWSLRKKEEYSESERAKKYIRNNRKKLLDKFTNSISPAKETEALTLFLAGAPGAGKTEFAKVFKSVFLDKNGIVHIDADEIKSFIPQYDGKNSQIYQGASAIGVEKLYDEVLKKNLHVIFDATFSLPLQKTSKNIQRSIDKHRKVWIIFLFQNPEISWNFTKDREIEENRHVPRKVFIKAFLQSGKNVLKVKKTFFKKVTVVLVQKNLKNKLESVNNDATEIEIEKFIEKSYNNMTRRKLFHVIK